MEDKETNRCFATSTEAEYQSTAATTSELVWLKSLSASLGVFFSELMKLYCDSQVAVHIAKNPVFHERTKHIKINCHFVREMIHSGDLEVLYVSTK